MPFSDIVFLGRGIPTNLSEHAGGIYGSLSDNYDRGPSESTVWDSSGFAPVLEI